ncbi:DUF2169 domain-containing protein [Pseudothauera nasutitermitis]|uniref:DUF2169 domain-containing protein n=1 Tax=Pseudothauera nasutitermitis TaxID=2565930 RepID=A0A4S4AUT3_9RHOO|nr:DUF2169 domain-containing protein [Pseudothauera nasutitermitis]THF63706.1 DUF2169 domain-containing protein [Pseudothauera nasutitermitis]
MKIVKPLTLGVLDRPYRYRGTHRLAVAALGFFPLGAGALDRLLADNLQWAKLVPALPAGLALEHILPKARGEVLLSGSAHAAEAVPALCVRLHCGPVDKCLQVIGERAWTRRLWPAVCVEAPAPFKEMPLTWERAYGGAGHDNPQGRAFLPRLAWLRARAGAMPNIEYPGLPVMPGRRRLPAAGFAPQALLHAEQARRASGTYDKRWLAEDFPGLPRDFDCGLFNRAPADQQFAGALRGDEPYTLEGLHPRHALLRGQLPGLRARAFLLREGQGAEAAEEIALACDTVWFFPDQDVGLLVFRGEAPVHDSDALDVQALMVAYEKIGEARPLAHYRDVLGLRLDPATAPLHAFNEAQLAPPRSAGEIAARMAQREAEAAARQAERQQLLDEQMADFWTHSGLMPPAGYTPPRVEPPPLAGIPPDALAEGEFDLAELHAQATALAEQARAEGEARLAAEQERLRQTLREQFPDAQPPAAPTVEAVTARVLDQAREEATDLVAPQDLKLPAELAEALDRAEAAQPGSVGAEQRAQIARSLATAPSLKRAARAAALTPTTLPAELPAAAARALGRQVVQWLSEGTVLAGRDLAGADLRDADLRGADLRETQLERADLRGARLDGANLAGAVLTAARLDGAWLAGACLDGANLSGSSAAGADFGAASLRGAKAVDAVWREAKLAGALLDDLLALRIDLSAACLDDSRAARAVFAGMRAPASRWRQVHWEQVVAQGAQLGGADFSGARLSRAVLLDAALAASQWPGAELAGVYGGQADWQGANLRGARLRRCGLRGATLRGADLGGGVFAQSDFGEADLSDACLEGARLYRSLFLKSRLRRVRGARADFFQAMCRKADFSQAMLSQAVLAQMDASEADFSGAARSGAFIDQQARLP